MECRYCPHPGQEHCSECGRLVATDALDGGFCSECYWRMYRMYIRRDDEEE